MNRKKISSALIGKRTVRVYACADCCITATAQELNKNCRVSKCPGTVVHFASKAEYNRYVYLKGLAENGLISCLERQKKFFLTVNGVVIGHYSPDYTYFDKDGALIVEDVKSRNVIGLHEAWKIKHFEAEYKIKVFLV